MKHRISLAPKVTALTAQPERLDTQALTKLCESLNEKLYGAIAELNATGAYTENARSSVIDALTSDMRYVQKAIATFCRRPDPREYSNIHSALRVFADRVALELAFTRSVSMQNTSLTRLNLLLELMFTRMPNSYRGRDMFADIRDSDGRPHRPNSLLRTGKHKSAERMYLESLD